MTTQLVIDTFSTILLFNQFADVTEKTPLTASQEEAEILTAQEESSCTDSFVKICSVFITTARGWKTYIKQDIMPAGQALSLLYMTVIGFDNITNGE